MLNTHRIMDESLLFIERSFVMRYASFYPFQQRAEQQNFMYGQSTFPPNFSPPRPIPQNQQFMSSPNHITGDQEGQGISKIERYMATADKFLTTAQQFAPLAQQFAPMLNNLPAMWKLYKGFQSLPSNPSPTTPNPQTRAPNQPSPIPNPTTPLSSTPKIFQPPFP